MVKLKCLLIFHIYKFDRLFSVRGKLQKLLLDFVHPKLILLVMHLILNLEVFILSLAKNYISDRVINPTSRNSSNNSSREWIPVREGNFFIGMVIM